MVGPVSQVYDYTYKTNSLHTLESIAVGSVSIKPETDVQGRNKGKSLYINSVKVGEENISYRKVSDHATNMPSTVWFGDKTNGTYQIKDSIRYAYDKMGNIEKVYENGELAIRYQYDALNRLVREDNKTLDKTYVFVYDNNGNIVKRREFSFTLKDNTLIEELESTDKVYIYNGDQMVSYNGQTCVYDLMGNPTMYRGKTATWVNGRRLAGFDGHTFTYDGQGRRLTKDSLVFAYDSNGRLIKQGDNMEFFYDQTGVVGLKYGTATYLYRKDAQGNVIALIGENGAIVARYLYDAWGEVSVVDNNGSLISDVNHIGNLNPFRYRGYYYDTETKLYFLKTRYYDPEAGRFISQDGVEYLDPDTINGLNLYAYCGNNPVMNVDPNGNAWWNPFSWDWGKILTGVGLVVTAVAAVALAVVTFGAGTPLAMGIVAGVTLAAGVLTGINGIATIGEGISGGYNFVRDGLFNSVLGLSDNAYNIYSGVVEGVAIVGSTVLGMYNMTGRAKAARYGREFLGKGYSKVAKGRWASADGLRQMIFDNTHHLLDGVRTNTHFNLYTHATNFLKGKSTIIAKLHVFYDLFKIWFR